MTSKASLLASLFASMLLAACAAETSDPGSESAPADQAAKEPKVGQTQEALCPVGQDCTPIRTGSSRFHDIATTDGTLAPPNPAPSFTCSTKRNGCDPVLTYDPATQTYVCVWGCGGGGFGYARYNPCPSWAPNYVCTPYGTCSCY